MVAKNTCRADADGCCAFSFMGMYKTAQLKKGDFGGFGFGSVFIRYFFSKKTEGKAVAFSRERQLERREKNSFTLSDQHKS